jgi:FkbM family methyltransferase
MTILKQLTNLLNHPLNKKRKFKTFLKIIWWKANQLFFKFPAIIQMTKEAKLVCYPNSSYGSFVVYANFPEFEEMNFIYETVNNGDTVLDVGANIGAISILAASRGTKVQVFSFEPTEKLIPLIEENINVNKFQNRIEVIKKAVSDKTGKLQFILESESEINHISSKDDDSSNSIEVDSINLDSFVREKSLGIINLLKVDVEGAELSVFRGSQELFDKKRVEVIVFELNKNISNFGYNEKTIINFLKHNRFFVFELNKNKLQLVNNRFKSDKTTNLIAVLKNKKAIKKVFKYLQ